MQPPSTCLIARKQPFLAWACYLLLTAPVIAQTAFAQTAVEQLAVEQGEWPQAPDANGIVKEYLRQQTEEVSSADDLRRFTSAAQWEEAAQDKRRELAEMLGLVPEPPRGDVRATVVDTIERDGIVVEKLHYQPVPGLYVAANLYRPVSPIETKLPTVLYVCGHSGQHETIDGQRISYGNKTGYQRHGAWLARHGFVCLTIDTIQWGEFLGQHWGTYQDNRWDWFSRGYTPAGVEAWSGIRAVDYLISRDDVDPDRIAVTGRSGGGAYSWFVAALDQRIKVAIPVAGITTLKNHVVDDCVEGHCDCMFFVNYHRWDYPTLAALIAPRPLLIANSDNDTIFPLDGVLETAKQTQHIYDLLGVHDNLGLLITPGPHKDTPELQVGAFRWLQRFLQNKDVPIDEAATERFHREELRVFTELPADEQVTSADRLFSDPLIEHTKPLTDSAAAATALELQLKSLAFSAWPQQPPALDAKKIWQRENDDSIYELWEFTSQQAYRLWAIYERPKSNASNEIEVHLADTAEWESTERRVRGEQTPKPATARLTVAVRGTGPFAWSGNSREMTHIARRFYLLGQTVAGMQTWDALRAMQLAEELAPKAADVSLSSSKSLEPIAIYATAMSPEDVKLEISELPENYLSTSPLLGAARITGLDAWLSHFLKQ